MVHAFNGLLLHVWQYLLLWYPWAYWKLIVKIAQHWFNSLQSFIHCILHAKYGLTRLWRYFTWLDGCQVRIGAFLRDSYSRSGNLHDRWIPSQLWCDDCRQSCIRCWRRINASRLICNCFCLVQRKRARFCYGSQSVSSKIRICYKWSSYPYSLWPIWFGNGTNRWIHSMLFLSSLCFWHDPSWQKDWRLRQRTRQCKCSLNRRRREI